MKRLPTKGSRYEGTYTPTERAAAIAFDALWYAAYQGDFAPNDTPGYRRRVRTAILRMLEKIGMDNNFDWTPPRDPEAP